MKSNGIISKAFISCILALTCLSFLNIFAFAGDKKEFEERNLRLSYGEIVPTDAKFQEQRYSYKFIGDEGYFYFKRLSKGKKDAYTAVRIYDAEGKLVSDNAQKLSTEKGSSSFKGRWPLKLLHSGIYKGECFTFYVDSKGVKIKDTLSVNNFTIDVNRVANKTVTLKSASSVKDGLKISWDKLPTATKYVVYRREGTGKKWAEIGTATTNSFVDKNVKNSKTYYYTVQAFDGKYKSKFNSKGISGKFITTPVINSIYSYGADGSAKIKWNKISGATGYRVYRRGGSLDNYSWKYIAYVKGGSNISYLDKNAKSTKWRYEYTVRAVSGKLLSGFEENYGYFDYIPAPTLKSAALCEEGIKVNWSTNDKRIQKFYVYRKDGKAWKYLGSTTDTSFIDKSKLESGKTYTYTVKGLSKLNAGSFNNNGVSESFIGIPKLNSVSFNYTGKAVVNWTSVNGATGYRIYRKINNASSWKLIGTVNSGKTVTFYDDIEKKGDYKYTYTVRAFDKAKSLGYFDKAGVSATFLNTPDFKLQQVTTENSLAIEVKWDGVKDAVSYNVYRRIPNGKWQLQILKTDKTSYIDEKVELGANYEYAVRAFNEKGDVSAYNTVGGFVISKTELTGLNVSETGVTLNWTPIDGTTTYKVYRKADSSDEFTLLAEVTEPQYTDTSAEALVNNFSYAVTVCGKDNESELSNSLDNFVSCDVQLELNKETATIGGTWACEEAEALTVTKVVNDGESAVILDVKKGEEAYNGSFNDNVTEGDTFTYTFTFKVSGKIDAVKVISIYFPHPPLNMTSLTVKPDYNNGNPFAKLSWQEVEFADEYVVIRKNGETSTELAVIKKNQINADGFFYFTDDTITAEADYIYNIKAVATESVRDASISSDVAVKLLTPMEKTVVEGAIVIEGEKVNCKLNWQPVHFADTYEVYRENGSLWDLVGQVTIDNMSADGSFSFVDENVVANSFYSYKIIAKDSLTERAPIESDIVNIKTTVPETEPVA